MIVDVSADAASVTMTLTPHPEDTDAAGRATRARTECGVWAPREASFGRLHPDLIVLSTVLVAQPWTARRLVVRGVDGVSDALAEAVEAGTGIAVDVAGGSLPPREAPAPGRPALAFSGGVDSMAAAILMPSETASAFLNRVGPSRRASGSYYRSESALRAVAELRAAGLDAHAVDSDLEYTRTPIGFPTHWANAIPSLLLADSLGLRSISWGAIFEASYGVGGPGFTDWATGSAARKLRRLFAAVGMPVSPVVMGLSEVGTAGIVRGSRFDGFARSCLRGTSRPCRACNKCFRKGLLDVALAGGPWVAPDLGRYYRAASVRHELRGVPMHAETIYGFLLSTYVGSDPVLVAMRDLLQATTRRYDAFTRWYEPAGALLHEADRAHVTARIRSHVDVMSADEIEQMRSWRTLGDDGYGEPGRRLQAELDRYDGPLARVSDLRKRARVGSRLRAAIGRVAGG